MSGIMSIPPKSLADLVKICQTGTINKDFVKIGDNIWEFIRGNTVISVIGPLDVAIGHQQRSPFRADEIRRTFAAALEPK